LNIKGGANAGASTAPPADDASKHTAIGGSYNFGVARLSLVNTVSKANTNPLANRDVMSVGLTVPMGAYTILAGYNKDSKAAANGDTKIAAGVNYALSKRTTIGADVFKADAQFVPGSTTTYSSNVGTGFVLRVGHTF
jgi:predicted porin